MGDGRTPEYPYKGLIPKSQFSWALARTIFSIFDEFWPGLDQAVPNCPNFARMANQASLL